MIHHCNTCGLRDPSQPVCLLTGRKINPAADYCSVYCRNPHKCTHCGKIVLDFIIEEPNIFCYQCLDRLSTCEGCSKYIPCGFETDPSPIPKMIVKTIRQGPIIQQMQIPNPDRIAITCKLNCPCWNGEYCGRETNYCTNYDYRYFVPTVETEKIQEGEENDVSLEKEAADNA